MKVERKRKADKKRREDLEQIAMSIRSTSGFDSGAGQDPVEVLPKEIWLLILDQLETPNDLSNARWSCTLFLNLLAEKVNKIFFAEAIKIRKFYDLLEPETSYEGHEEEDYEDTSLKMKLSLRLVCQSWNKAFETKLHADMEEWLNTHDHHPFESFDNVLLSQWLDTDQSELHEVLVSINDPQQSSVADVLRPVRSVNMVEYDVSKWETLKHMMDTYIKCIGGQIWHLDLCLWMEEADPNFVLGGLDIFSSLYLNLTSWFAQVTSLKWLSISLTGPEMEEEERLTLRNMIIENPFPTLETLEQLTLRLSRYGVPISLYEIVLYTAILNANPHLKKLVLRFDGIFTDTIAQSIVALSHIEVISFRFRSFANNIEHLTAFTNFAWNLKKIHISTIEMDVTMSILFRFLERFPTLQNVSIVVSGVALDGAGRSFLFLPEVTSFKYKFLQSDNFMPAKSDLSKIDFMLPMKKLESFAWIVQCYSDAMGETDALGENEEDSEVIEFKKGYMDLYKSNLWDIFPSLDEVEVETYFTPRKMYRRKLRPEIKTRNEI